MPLLPDKKRALNPVSDERFHLPKRFGINKDCPYFTPFPFYPDCLLLEVDILDIHVAEFGYPDSGRVDRPDNQLFSGIGN